ncbi:hypothetical protein BS78_01G026900 [Paspalum vaginatum]|nr:hypothetical protein BS78_01G026900 [Paspalum vaginatum]
MGQSPSMGPAWPGLVSATICFIVGLMEFFFGIPVYHSHDHFSIYHLDSYLSFFIWFFFACVLQYRRPSSNQLVASLLDWCMSCAWTDGLKSCTPMGWRGVILQR